MCNLINDKHNVYITTKFVQYYQTNNKHIGRKQYYITLLIKFK